MGFFDRFKKNDKKERKAISKDDVEIEEDQLMLKKIATFAREELEERLQSKVFLEMFVRVEENWRNRQFQLKELGYIDKE